MLTTNRPTLMLCTLLSVLVAATGCVVGEDLSPPGEEPAPDELDARGLAQPGSSDPCGYQAMSAETFYQQFAYREAAEGYVGYRVGSTYDVRTRLPNGDEVNLRVRMLANGRAIASYEERHFTASNFYDTVNETVIVTRSVIDPTSRKLTLVGLATGTPSARIDDGLCGPSIALTYSQNIGAPGLAGKTTAIVPVWSTAFVIDPDNLAEVPYAWARRQFEDKVAAGTIRIVRH